MAKDLWEASVPVRDLFEKTSAAAGMDARKLLFDSTAEELKATDKTQVAMTIACLCSSAALREKGIEPEGVAGFSLGEYAALYEAGVIGLDDLFSIVKIRGELMENAARRLDSQSGQPGMAAVLGISAETVAAAIEKLGRRDVFIANHNSPVQVVISGASEGLSQAEQALKAAGARRLVRLSVSGPFHSPLMANAAKAFGEALASFRFADPRIPVFSNVTGAAIRTGEEAKELCGKQLVSMVRWVAVEESLLAMGFDRFFEAGPGTVLIGLMRALRPDVRCLPAGTREGIAKSLENGA